MPPAGVSRLAVFLHIMPNLCQLERLIAVRQPARLTVCVLVLPLLIGLAGCGAGAPVPVPPGTPSAGGTSTANTAGPASASASIKPATANTATEKSTTEKTTSGKSTAEDSNSSKPAAKNRITSFPKFVDVAKQVGIDFTYDNGATGRVLMVESTGGGGGWLDFDGDGRWDLFLCQGGDPVAEVREAQPRDQLFRQVQPGVFEHRTDEAKLNGRRYSQGLSVGDYDDDGFDDIFVTNVGRDTLLHNEGDGTFTDVTPLAGVGDERWGSSAAWSDLDGDGDLDLYVCNYLAYDPYHPIPCNREDGKPATCHPRDVPAVPDECYFSQGDGTFLPEAQQRGLFGEGNKALGVVVADLNNDGLRDIYVANDTTPNFLFINQGAGQFKESAQLLGCAVSREGLAQASMGIAFGDFDRNGWFDLYCTHFTYESSTLYKNLGAVGFQDVTGLVGLHSPTFMKLGFGSVMLDFNQDGHDEIFVANGHIDDWRYKGESREMQAQLFSYEGPRFVECGDKAGDYFDRKLLGRGVAQCDFDDDGDWDLTVVHQNVPVSLLRNDSERGHWLKLRFIAQSNRRGVGTRVVLTQSGKSLTQELAGGTSYCASHEPALIFGLAKEIAPCELTITWPDGKRQVVQNVAVDQKLVIRQAP